MTQPAVSEDFAGIVTADPDLLRAEFDEIISAEWPSADHPLLTAAASTVLTGAVEERPRSHLSSPHSGDGTGREPLTSDCRTRQRSPPY